MIKHNVKNKKKALKGFFDVYAHDIEGSMHDMSKIELLEYLGTFNNELGDDDRENICNYHNSDIFIGVASGATGIPEFEFMQFALKYFNV